MVLSQVHQVISDPCQSCAPLRKPSLVGRWWDEGPSETERAVLATLASVISREEHGAYRNAVEGESDAAAGDAPNGEAATGADAAPRKLPTISFKGFKEQFSRAARNISFKLSVALDRRRGA
mmetsp:Transcript_47171/g.131103  ORF Transcript_47171/g.131103 Transcript_47171/m.131103 type:complete len:122 (+) Transcript_47171:550-915(+)